MRLSEFEVYSIQEAEVKVEAEAELEQIFEIGLGGTDELVVVFSKFEFEVLMKGEEDKYVSVVALELVG